MTLRDVRRHGMRPHHGGETASISLIPSSLLRCTSGQPLHAVSSVYVVVHTPHCSLVSRLHLVLELAHNVLESQWPPLVDN